MSEELCLLTNKHQIDDTADLISKGEVVATCLGRAEYGSRALGHRSILCKSSDFRIREYLNQDVKHRELFRPFAPIMLTDSALNFLSLSERTELMTKCYIIPDEMKSKMPAAVHVDSTARIQTIDADGINHTSPIVTKLLKKLGQDKNFLACINTSFNDAGEPMVNSFLDAYKTLKKTNIQYMLTDFGLFSIR